MPDTNTNDTINKADKADLAYAVHTLVKDGRVTPEEIGRLIVQRKERILTLTSEVAELQAIGAMPPHALDNLYGGAYGGTYIPTPKPIKNTDEALHRLRGKLHALIQHRVKSPNAKNYWRSLPERIGYAKAVEALVKATGADRDQVPLFAAKQPPADALPTVGAVREARTPKQTWRRLTGLYGGYLRGVKNITQRRHIMKVRREQGLKAAVAVMTSLHKAS